MKSRILTLIAITLFAALAIPARLAAQEHIRYKVVDVGTLGGPNSIPPLPFFEGSPAGPESLSRAGTFTGQADTATTDPFAPNCFGDCFVSHAIQWRDGVLTDLGALHSSESLSSASRWISVNGLIAGFSQNGEIDPLNPDLLEIRAVLWKHGKITDLGTLEGGYESEAFAVNARGQVVGAATNGIPDPSSIVGVSTQVRAFLWQNGAMQDLGTLPGGTDAVALLVNERGQIVGQSYTASSIPRPPTFICFDFPLTLHGFLWEDGKMVDLGTLGGSCAFTYALNSRGQVVGQATLVGDQTSHPYTWDRKRGIKDLGTLGGTYGFASGINDPGVVAGTATNQDDEALLAFLWKDGVISNLGTLPGNGCSGADAINSKGQVVGGSGFFLPDFFPGCTDTVEHAFLWENGTMVDLNAFVPSGSDLTLNEAVFINDRGEISGFGTLPNGDFHAFLLIPCGRDDTQGCQDATGGTTAKTHVSAVSIPRPATQRDPASGNPFNRMLPHLVAPDTLVSRLRSATTEIDTQSCRAERGTYIPHCPTRRKLSSPQRRAKREDNMKPTILTPILAVASLTVLAVPARLAAQVGGTGTTNRIPIWTDSTTLGNSIIFQTGGLRVGTSLQVIGGSGRAGFFGINGGTGGSIKLTAGAGGSAGRSDSNGGSGGSVFITGGNGASGTTCCAQNVNGNGGSITLQPGAGGAFVLTHGLPGNVILAPTRGKVGIRTATPTATLDVGAGGTTLADAWITRSARRFKTNIQPLERALEKVEHLQGVSYERKADGRHEIGVVAEDVDQVVPEVVSRDPKTRQVQGVDYSRLAALLIEAVKAQQVEIQHLKAQIEQLTSNSVGQ